jgi:hypothetical protein
MEGQVALGYMRAMSSSDPRQLDRLRQQMASFAADRGLELGEIFVESNDAANSAFAALMDAISATGAAVVVVPSMHYLANFEGVGVAMKQHIERETGASVLLVAADGGERGAYQACM